MAVLPATFPAGIIGGLGRGLSSGVDTYLKMRQLREAMAGRRQGHQDAEDLRRYLAAQHGAEGELSRLAIPPADFGAADTYLTQSLFDPTGTANSMDRLQQLLSPTPLGGTMGATPTGVSPGGAMLPPARGFPAPEQVPVKPPADLALLGRGQQAVKSAKRYQKPGPDKKKPLEVLNRDADSDARRDTLAMESKLAQYVGDPSSPEYTSRRKEIEDYIKNNGTRNFMRSYAAQENGQLPPMDLVRRFRGSRFDENAYRDEAQKMGEPSRMPGAVEPDTSGVPGLSFN